MVYVVWWGYFHAGPFCLRRARHDSTLVGDFMLDHREGLSSRLVRFVRGVEAVPLSGHQERSGGGTGTVGVKKEQPAPPPYQNVTAFEGKYIGFTHISHG